MLMCSATMTCINDRLGDTCLAQSREGLYLISACKGSEEDGILSGFLGSYIAKDGGEANYVDIG